MNNNHNKLNLKGKIYWNKNWISNLIKTKLFK